MKEHEIKSLKSAYGGDHAFHLLIKTVADVIRQMRQDKSLPKELSEFVRLQTEWDEELKRERQAEQERAERRAAAGL